MALEIGAPPEDRDEAEQWMLEQADTIARYMAGEAARITRTVCERYAASLTAAGDVGALDGIEDSWRVVVNDVSDAVGIMHLSGSMSAFTSNPGWQSIDASTVSDWSAVVNQAAVEYQDFATNRIVGASDVTWSSVRQRTVEGLRTGMTNEALKDEIQAITGYSEYRADTIGRTETMAAYSGGDISGARALGVYGPVEKVWMARVDARTRPSHKRADNQYVPLDEPFSVGGRDLDRPLDPGAPPEEVVNCRCVLGFLYPGDTRPDGSVVPERTDVEPVAQRSEFAQKMDGHREKVLSSREPGDWMNDREDKFGRLGVRKPLRDSEKALRRAGKDMRREVDKRLKARKLKTPKQIRADIARKEKRMGDALDDAANRWAIEHGYTDRWAWVDAEDIDLSRMRAILSEYDPKVDRTRQQWLKAWKQQIPDEEAYKAAFKDAVREVLDEIRGAGRPPGAYQVNAATDELRAYGKQLIGGHGEQSYDHATRWLPRDWIEASESRGRLWIGDIASGQQPRGFHQFLSGDRYFGEGPIDSVIHIPLGQGDDAALAVHEFGHRIEQLYPEIRAHEWAFVRRRAQESGESAVKKLSELTGHPGYRDYEVAYEDKFKDQYVGKIYSDKPDAAFEVLSMGLQYIEEGKVIHDPDFIEWTLGVLATL